MKAIVQVGYGSPAVLQLRDVEMPRIDDRGVLVKVRAASINARDWHIMRGVPYILRAFAGLPAPRQPVSGVDLAGRVEAVGTSVTSLKPGDEVFGGGNGSFAEYTATTPDRLALRSAAITPEQAASLHIAGLTALQGLRDKAGLKPGQRALINGAGGGVGTFAVQIAKWLGARVTAVTRTETVDLVRAIGADEVIDYCLEDFTLRAERHDVLFDVGGNRSLSDSCRVLAGNGTLVMAGARVGRWLAPVPRLLRAAALSKFGSRRLVPFIAKKNPADLALLMQLTETGKIRPVIDRQYALSEAADALAYVGAGLARGKVVIKVLM